MSEPAQIPHILVVVEDDNIATAILYVLGRQGFLGERASNGQEALTRLAGDGTDLVMLDILLPDISGYDLCRRLRRDPDQQHRKILMMTARGSATERRKAIEHGADGFITKPFDPNALRAELGRLLPPPA